MTLGPEVTTEKQQESHQEGLYWMHCLPFLRGTPEGESLMT